ncbi:hypothetical protein cypCar_00001019 [Cyprinus carpio]|nr:hypothetical protein cypCar_00001019 [Cyprinus carpio]
MHRFVRPQLMLRDSKQPLLPRAGHLCTNHKSVVSSVRGYVVLPPTSDEEEKAMLHRMMRVDHAGEYGANRIYAGQMAVLGRTQISPLIQEMWDQEKQHLRKFNEILAENRVRAGSALLGKEGAMACTVAVEESISEHYNSQIRTLMEKDPEKYTELLQVPGYQLMKAIIQVGCKAAIYISERL